MFRNITEIARAERDFEMKKAEYTASVNQKKAEADLAYLQPASREIPAGYGEVFKQILEYLHSTISEIRRAPKPFIAAVDGVAVGAGLNMALGCDVVIATTRARFSEIFVRRGLTLDFGGSWLLPRIVGLQRAKELALSGRIIPMKSLLPSAMDRKSDTMNDFSEFSTSLPSIR